MMKKIKIHFYLYKKPKSNENERKFLWKIFVRDFHENLFPFLHHFWLMDIIAGMPDMQKVENSLSKARRMMAMDQFAKRTKELFILSFKENGSRNDWIFKSSDWSNQHL